MNGARTTTDGAVVHGPRGSTARRAVAVALAVVAMGGILLLLTHLGLFSRPSSLADRMRGGVFAEIAPREVTDEVCPPVNCLSAWETEVGRFVEFRHEGDAEYRHVVLGDEARRNDRVLVDFSGGEYDRDQVRHAVDVLFHDRDWT